MENHKVIEIFRSFDKSTCRKFSHFLKADFPRHPPKIVTLGEYLISYYPDFKHENLTEEGAFKAMGLEGEFSKHELTRYLSKLLSAIEEFIAINTLLESNYLKGSLIAEYYYQNRNHAGFSKFSKLNTKELEASSVVDDKNYFYSYLNKKLRFNYAAHQRHHEEAHQYLGEAVVSLDNYYLIQVLQAAIAFNAQPGGTENEKEIPFLTMVLEFIASHPDYLSPLVSLSHLTYKLVKDKSSPEIYTKLKMALLRHIRVIPSTDAYTMTVILNNALGKQLSEGRKRYLEERFDTYKLEIEEGWISSMGIIGYPKFNNVVTVALSLGKIAYAEHFIQAYEAYLIPDIKDDIVNLNRARVEFANGAYASCLSLVNQSKYIDASVTLTLKRLQVMCFYEMGDDDQFSHRLNAMKTYLYRLEGAEVQKLKTRNLLFAKIATLLGKGPVVSSQIQEEILGLIEEAPFLPELEWIESKLEKGS